MLAFDPSQRITVPEALEHPWLASYHDANDEPDCPAPYDKWRYIEKLETIEEYREALWNEIEEYRKEVRSMGFDMAMTYNNANASQPLAESAVANEIVNAIGAGEQGRPATPPGIVVEDGRGVEAESTTAVDEGVAGKETVINVSKDEKSEERPSTDSVTVTAGHTLVHSPGAAPTAFRPGMERHDSMRPPTPRDMANDPVVTYARRSSILQAQHMQGGSTSASPVRRAGSTLPTYGELREGFAVPAPTPPPMASALSGGSSAAGVPGGSIPFPTVSAGSYIVPARSRTASMAGGESGSLFGSLGPRKLLRTLSTVSIHESAESLGGLAAMGPMGAAIIERRETAADAPPSEMPRDFGTVREEDGEYPSRSGSGRASGIGSASGSSADMGADSSSKKLSTCDSKARTPGSAAAEGSGSSGAGTSAKKKEKRFIIF